MDPGATGIWVGGVWAHWGACRQKCESVQPRGERNEQKNNNNQEIRVCFTLDMMSTTNQPLVQQDLPVVRFSRRVDELVTLKIDKKKQPIYHSRYQRQSTCLGGS